MTVYQVRFNWVVAGKESKNVCYFDIDAAVNQDLQDTADFIRLQFATHLAPLLSSDCTLVNLTYRQLSGGAPFSFEQDFTLGPLVGGSGSTLFDQTSPLLVSYRANDEKPNRGRANVPGMTEATWDGNAWTAAAQQAAFDVYDAFAAGFPITSGNAILGICRPDLPNNNIVAFRLINAINIRTYSRKLTSRRPN